MAHPATEWLFARLSRGPADSRDVISEATRVGITDEELDAARGANNVEETERKPIKKKKYVEWSLPPAPLTGFRKGYDPKRRGNLLSPPVDIAPTPGNVPAAPELVRADLVPPTKRTPKEHVEVAKNRLRKRAPRYAQYLDDLARKASEDAAPCPTCGRGTPRSEEVRLRAIVAALDRGGVTPPRSNEDDASPSGPLLVFPPGTKIGIIVQTPEASPPVVGHGALRITRGDELGA